MTNNIRGKVITVGKALGLANAVKVLKAHGKISDKEIIEVGKVLDGSREMHDVAPLYSLAVTMPDLMVQYDRIGELWDVSLRYIPPTCYAEESDLLDAVHSLKRTLRRKEFDENYCEEGFYDV